MRRDVLQALVVGALVGAVVCGAWVRSPCASPRPQEARAAELARLADRLGTEGRMAAFERIRKTNAWASPESRSGKGSEMNYTGNARALLAEVLARLHVRTIADSPCGDCNWQANVTGMDRVEYLGIDLVPALVQANRAKYAARPNMRFALLDMIYEVIPGRPDVVLCRDMIQHNTLQDGLRTYAAIEASGARYLVTTWHQHPETDPAKDSKHNRPIATGKWYPVDVMLPPFNFPSPLFWIREGENGKDPRGKVIGVFALPALRVGNGTRFEPSEATFEAARSRVIFETPGPAAAWR